jgi:hypothetical protein
MSTKTRKILLTIFLCAWLGALIYMGTIILNPFSLGRLLTYIGLFTMFGSSAIYYLGCVITSRYGDKIMGEFVSIQRQGADDFYRKLVIYSYIDKNGKYKFISFSISANDTPNKTILLKCFGIFKWIDNETDIQQDDYYSYKLTHIDINEAKKKHKKFAKVLWRTLLLGFLLCSALITIGVCLS